MKGIDENKSEQSEVKLRIIAEDKHDEIMNDNSIINENNLTQQNEIISSINNDVKNNLQIANKIELENLDEAINAENQHTEEKKEAADLEEKESSNINTDNVEEECQNSNIITNDINMEDAVANQAELSTDEQYATSNNKAPNKEAIQISSETEGANLNELIFILRVQSCRESQVPRGDSSNVIRSRSPNNRNRSTSRRRRRRPRGAVAQESPPVEGPSQELNEGEAEEDDVAYELITTETVPCKMTRTWRIIPKYKRLTVSEVSKQEADLYYSFLKETNPEKVEPVGPDDRQCCICFENKATRIVAPCGHLCLCYNCAKAIAFNRTILASTRVQKKCPLCRAAISKIMRVL